VSLILLALLSSVIVYAHCETSRHIAWFLYDGRESPDNPGFPEEDCKSAGRKQDWGREVFDLGEAFATHHPWHR
jgi:hypothetical protein